MSLLMRDPQNGIQRINQMKIEKYYYFLGFPLRNTSECVLLAAKATYNCVTSWSQDDKMYLILQQDELMRCYVRKCATNFHRYIRMGNIK